MNYEVDESKNDMVTIESVQEIRPNFASEFLPTTFIPRTENIAEAYRWGKELHEGQLRLSGEPYFETHCVWVAALLDNLVQNEAWTIAALLHDSIEDKGSTLDQIRQKFPGALGEEVAYIVDGVTKLSSPHEGHSREIETLRKLARFRDLGVFLVKLADKSHNVLTLEYMPEEKRRQKATEAIRAYGRLAGILNCYQWRRWLEDTAFPHADPETFAYVKEKLDHDPRLNLEFIHGYMEQLARVMEKAGIHGSVDITVNGYWQSWQKLRRMARERKASMNDFSEVNDVISFRLVVDSENERDCYMLLGDVNRFLGAYLDQNRFDDYIACPQNGYRALQATAYLPKIGAIEVAIATRDMEGENLWGVVYCIQKGKDTSNYNPVEILTPTGGTRFVPEGSTVLDAVATIQQEFLLDKISAVEVNGNLARLSDKVKPGDIVEVITSGKRLTPSEEWLNFCNITTARLLRSVLATEALKQSAEIGRKKIEPLLASKGIIDLEDVQYLESDRLAILLERLACANLSDLYAAVGSEAIRMEDLAQELDHAGISKDQLQWTNVYIQGSKETHRPGVLAKLTTLIFEQGGNILRSITDTGPDGSFIARLVIGHLTPEKAQVLKSAFENCGIPFSIIEVV